MSSTMRKVGSLVGVVLIGCGGTPAEPVGDLLPDGDFSISLTDPTLNGPAPGWVLNEPTIDFTKSGNSLNVTGSTNDIASTGQPGLSQILADHSWNVLFPVSPSVSGPGEDSRALQDN